MSNYGKDKLKTIISLTELSVETKKPSSSENQTDNSTFQESDILTLTQEEYISLQNQDDIGVVELPNDFDLLTELIIPTVTVTTTEHELSHTTPISTTTQLGQTQKNIQSVTNKKITLAPSTSTKPSDTLTTIIRTPTVITNTSSTKTSMHTCTPLITAQPTQTTVHTHTTTNPTSDTLKTTNHTPNLISIDTAQFGQTQKAIQSVTNKNLHLHHQHLKTMKNSMPISLELRASWEKKVGRKRMYLVHWDGYPVTQATWEPKGTFHHPSLVAIIKNVNLYNEVSFLIIFNYLYNERAI
ncbi:unnamed protein product [Mytilus edulis]|uniref:Chromo domain-containing protein n=1 Tax=Mytilus edulis TaxID=6550 RepID=A0A8S3S0T7_MYTED|nr:unnamed protein product [Mytilus edulis]